MKPGTHVFCDIPENLRYHYRFLLKERPSDDDTWARQPRIKAKETRDFLDFIASMYGHHDWRIGVPGESVLHLWTRDDDWELVVKLAERFPHHIFRMTKTCRD